VVITVRHKTLLLIPTILIIIFSCGCLTESEHESGISGFMIFIEENELDISPFELIKDKNITEINISLTVKEPYHKQSLSFQKKNSTFIALENKFPLSIDKIEYDVKYEFEIIISFNNSTSSNIEIQIKGNFIVQYPDQLVLTIKNTDDIEGIEVTVKSDTQSIIQISNINVVFSVGITME